MNNDARTLEQLKQVDLFSSLSGRTLKRVLEAGRPVTHQAGKVIVEEGDGSIAFHLVIAGSAAVDVGGSARPPIGIGGYFGEVALLDGKPRTATVTAGPDGLVTFLIRRSDFLELLDKHPEMHRPIIEVLCQRLRDEQAGSHAR